MVTVVLYTVYNQMVEVFQSLGEARQYSTVVFCGQGGDVLRYRP
jgi:hypothetical protein